MALPATELAVRDWLRADPALVALVGGDQRRIDVEYSGSPDVTHLTMYRAGGAPRSDVPFDDAVMTFHCWGKGRGAALNLTTALCEKLRTATEQPLTTDAYLRSSVVETTIWLPDPTGQPRYAVIARLTAVARQTTTV